MPLPYRSIKDIYDPLVKAGVVTAPLPDWSNEMNALTGSDLYSAGLHDNFVKQGSIGLDRLLEATGLPDLTGYFGQQVGSAVGNPDAGERIGRGLPRMAVNFAPLAAGPWGLPVVAALSGAETYTETGSPAAGLLSGATNALMPGVAGRAEQAVLKRIGGQYLEGSIGDLLGKAGVSNVSRISQYLPKNAGQDILAKAGGQAGAALFGEASSYGQDLLAGNPLHNPFTTENLLNLTLGQAPFALAHLLSKGIPNWSTESYSDQIDKTAAAITKTQDAIAFQKAQDDAKKENPLGGIGDYVPPVTANPKAVAENSNLLAQLRGEKAKAEVEATPPSADDWNKMSQDEQRIIDQQSAITGGKGTVGGEALTPESERFNVVGKTVFQRPADPERNYPGFRIVQVADDPANVDQGLTPGHVVKYSTLHEPAPGTDPLGVGEVYSVPRRFSTVQEDTYGKQKAEQLAQQQAQHAATNPTLPFQEQPIKLDEYRGQLDNLKKLSDQLDLVTNETDLQKSLVDYNNLAHEMGYPPLDDAAIDSYRSTFDVDSVDKVAKAQLNTLMRRIAKKEAIRAESQQKADQLMAELMGPRAEALKSGEVLDTDAVALANQLEAARNNVGFDADRFNRLALEWNQAGRQGGIQGLLDNLYKAKKSGKGRQKVPLIEADKVEKLPVTPETAPITYQRTEIADAIASKVASDDPKLATDAANWVDWVEGGAKRLPASLEGKEHVEDWNDQLRQYVQRLAEKNSISKSLDSKPPESDHLVAGSDFVYSLAPFNAETNTLGGKHKLSKDGNVRVSVFRNIAGRNGNPIPQAEVELHKLLVPEAFDDKGNVNVKTLYDELPKRGASVETHVYGMEGKVSEAKVEMDKLTHEWVETLPVSERGQLYLAQDYNNVEKGIQFLQRPGIEFATADLENARKFLTLAKQVASEPLDTSPRATTYYRQISPFDTTKYPVTRVDVVLPGTDRTNDPFYTKPSNVLWSPDNLHENLPNTLGWAMVQFVPGPDGKPVMFVGEQQSRWGQSNQKAKAKAKEEGLPEDFAKLIQGPPDHPLLDLQHSLILKALVKEAAKRGVTKIVVSDAESAMMTEGHDKAALPNEEFEQFFRTRQEAQSYIAQHGGELIDGTTPDGEGAQWAVAPTPGSRKIEPPQAKGMRLHYDTTLPSALRKLTGDAGEKVDLGTHKNAFEKATQLTAHGQDMRSMTAGEWVVTDSEGTFRYDNEQQARDQLELGPNDPWPNNVIAYEITPERANRPIGSPVFKDAEGQPRTNVGGLSFDISSAIAKADAQRSRFTLTEPSRGIDDLMNEAKPYVPSNVATAATLREWQPERGAAGLLDRVARSPYPENAALAKALQGFPELVGRIKAEFWDMQGTSFAAIHEGKPVVVMDSSLLRNNDDFMERQVLHEVLHGMTKAELVNPTKVDYVTQLDALRQQMVDRLSTKGGDASDRAAYDRAVASNWMQRWNEGTATADELHANPKTRRVLYALLNNDELISQGFTSEDVRHWLQAQKMPKVKTAWNAFAGWVKSLLGIGENAIGHTAFDQLMSHTGQLLDQGEFVTSARNYFERFYENKGLSVDRVAEQTQRALGAVLDSKASPDMIMDNLFWKNAGELNPQLRQSAKEAQQMFQGGQYDAETANMVLAEKGVDTKSAPGVAGLNQLAHDIAVGDHSNPDLILESLPDSASKFMFEALKDVKEVLDGVKGAVSKQNKGLVGLADTEELRQSVDEAHKRLTKLLKLEQEHQQARTDILGMSTINPQGMRELTMNPTTSKSLDDIRAMVDPDSPKQGFLSWIERKLALPYQVARMDPRAAELVARVEQQVANAHKMKSESLKIFATNQIADTLKQAADLGINLAPGQAGGEMSHESLQRTLSVFKSPKLTKAVNDWIYENQKRNPGAEIVLADSDPEVQKILAGLTGEEKSQVNEALQKISVSKTSHDSQIVEKMTQMSSSAANKVLGRAAREFGLNLSLNDRMAITSQLLNTSLMDFNDPQQAAQAQASLSQVGIRIQQLGIPLEAYNQLLQFTNTEAEKIKLIRDNMAQRPGWVSGQDYGRYRIVWLDGNQQPHRWSGNDAKEAEAVARKASKVVEFTDRKTTDDEIHYPSMTPELINRIRELEETSWDIQGLTPEERQVARASSVANQVEREAGAQGVPGVVSPTRRLSRGAQDVPWAENHFSWVSSSANAWTRRLLSTQFDTHMAEPEVQASEQYRSWAKDYFEGFMRQDPEVATQMRKLTSIWFLGGNMASAIANPIGNAMRTLSEITSLTGKPVDSYSRYLRAASEVAGNFRSNKPWATPEHDQLIKDAIHERKVVPTLYDENAAAQEAVSTQFKQMIEGQKPQSWAKRLGTMAGSFTTAAMWPFRMGEIWNSQVAILSSFDLYREQGLSYDEAKAKAFEFNGSVNDSGGRANRPVGPFSARGELPRSAAMLATSMQNFVLGSTFQLVRYLKAGLFRPSGLTPHEVYSARIAATQMLAMQFAAAGILGLPFVSGALALLDKAFPELELNRKLREGSKSFFDSDKAGGNLLSDMAVTGLPSMFGWDFQSRLSMGNTLPGVSEVNGFQPENLLGPPVNLVSQFVRGGQRLVNGQGRLSDWTPPAVKKLVDLVASNGSVLDYKGRPVANDLTPGEKLGIGLGFQPKRISDFNAAERIATNADRVNSTKEAQYRSQLAEEVAKGNFGTVRQELLQRSQADKTFDPVAAVRGIATATEELSFPRDLRREGSGGTNGERSALLSAFRIDPQQPSEVQRLQLRKQVEQRLGLQSQTSRSELEQASLMDQLKASSPNATRQELRRSAEVALRRSGRQAQLEPVE